MGRVKTVQMKKLAGELLEKYESEFSDDFRKSKNKVDELTTITSKKVRNRIAGYITHLIQSRKRTKNIVVTYKQVPTQKGKNRRRK